MLNDPRTLVYSADDNGVVVNKPVSDYRDELQAYLRERETVNLAGMTRRTASSLCG